jgi:hypothetical protein
MHLRADSIPVRVKVRLQPAAADEGERLREIAIAAKASWGYDLERVRQWAAMGDFSPAGLRQKDVVVASVRTNAVGWIGVIRQQEVLWLDDLWVEPSWMGKALVADSFNRRPAWGRQRREQTDHMGQCSGMTPENSRSVGLVPKIASRSRG